MKDKSSNGKEPGKGPENKNDDPGTNNPDDAGGAGEGADKDNDDNSDNVIRIPSLGERDRIRKGSQAKTSSHNPWASQKNGSGGSSRGRSLWGRAYQDAKEDIRDAQAKEPFINLPPATKYLAASLILAYLVTNFFLPLITPSLGQWVMYHLSFIPARFTAGLPFTPVTLFTPVTYMWLHGGLMHIGLNTVMLVAFGAGIERWLGPRKLILIFLLCGLFGLVAHFMFYPTSNVPVIGASGGVSGFFAVILVMINQGRWRGGAGPMGGGIMPFAVLWVVISILSAFFSSMGGGTIAWAAHIGGFLGGFLLMRSYIKM